MLDDVVSLLLPHLCGDDVVVHPLLSFIALRAVAIVLQPTTRSVSHQRGSSSIVNHILFAVHSFNQIPSSSCQVCVRAAVVGFDCVCLFCTFWSSPWVVNVAKVGWIAWPTMLVPHSGVDRARGVGVRASPHHHDLVNLRVERLRPRRSIG